MNCFYGQQWNCVRNVGIDWVRVCSQFSSYICVTLHVERVTDSLFVEPTFSAWLEKQQKSEEQKLEESRRLEVVKVLTLLSSLSSQLFNSLWFLNYSICLKSVSMNWTFEKCSFCMQKLYYSFLLISCIYWIDVWCRLSSFKMAL